MTRKSRKRKKRRNWIKVIYISIFILLAFVAIKGFNAIMQTNVSLNASFSGYFYISTGSTFDQVCDNLVREGVVKNINTFRWVAERKNYINKVFPGKYKLKNGMSNNELVNLLRSGVQQPVKVRFQNIRTLEELAGIVSKNLETDSFEIISLLKDETFINKYGFSSPEILSMFIPNTYKFNWNTSAEAFFKRMAREYKVFWNNNRLNKARKMNLSQTEISTLASIVQAEQTIRKDERPIVAGLYVNRLKRGMRLESDPTIIYAKNDFTIKRVLNADRKIDSPYNTYLHSGLPPGPINIPDISAIDAVLNYQRHEYIFMCAKEDFSGYHNFSKTNAQHNIYAQRYRNELNKRKIYR